eukprot:TRINITY_DN91309_c0_g1_i1.p1 TRINITY_DN91309_c0_g1~~TRINITY_DN91309_c0_g1_i1.p1  ORF type:complete len:624 (-),score=79.17 TRINITY_DN91309_c0_g1_i1:65-1936(-)
MADASPRSFQVADGHCQGTMAGAGQELERRAREYSDSETVSETVRAGALPVHCRACTAVSHLESSSAARRLPRSAASVSVHVNFDDDIPPLSSPSSVASMPAMPATYGHWLTRSCRVDTSANLFGGQTLPERLSYFGRKLQGPERQFLLEVNREKNLGFGNRITAGNVIDLLANTDLDNRADDVVFVMKLGIALSSSGYSSVDVQYLLQAVCEGMALPLNRMDIGLGEMNASFGDGHSFLLRAGGGLQCDKILACVQLAKYACSGLVDGRAATMVLDEIMDRRKPYGQLVHIVAFVCLCTLSALSVRMGTYRDAVAAAMITPFPIIVLKWCRHGHRITELVDFLVPVAVGIGASIVWRFVEHTPACHVPTWFLAVLIDYLPGTQLVYAAYEFQLSSIIYSTSRLVRALLQCMLLTIGVITGWQVFGHNLAVAEAGGKVGAIASLPPSQECQSTAFHTEIWPLYYGVYNLPLLFVIMLGANVRLRDTPVPLLISYISLLLYGFLTYSDVLQLPAIVNNVLVVSFAAHLGSFHEYLTGTPPITVIVPVVFFLAPGSGTMVCILRWIHKDEGDAVQPQDLWGDLVMQGLSYAIGLHLATAIWRPLNFRRARRVTLQEHAEIGRGLL